MDILYHECGHCHGKGTIAYGTKSRNCRQCEGKGIIPTSLGEHIIIFMNTFCRNVSKTGKRKTRDNKNA